MKIFEKGVPKALSVCLGLLVATSASGQTRSIAEEHGEWWGAIQGGGSHAELSQEFYMLLKRNGAEARADSLFSMLLDDFEAAVESGAITNVASLLSWGEAKRPGQRTADLNQLFRARIGDPLGRAAIKAAAGAGSTQLKAQIVGWTRSAFANPNALGMTEEDTDDLIMIFVNAGGPGLGALRSMIRQGEIRDSVALHHARSVTGEGGG